MQKNYYIIQNGESTMHDKDFVTKRDAIQWCMKEVELDLKVGAVSNYYEVYNLLDVDRKVLYTTQGVIYKFMRDKFPALYPPKVKKETLFTMPTGNTRCDYCVRFTNGKGSDKLCDYHYNKFIDKATKSSVNRAIIEVKIDIAKALSSIFK